MTTRYSPALTGTTASIALGAFVDLHLTIPANSVDIMKVVLEPSVIGDGEAIRVEVFKRDTMLAADRCWTTGEFEGDGYAPKYDDGSGPVELTEGYVFSYEDLDETQELHIRIHNVEGSSKTVDYEWTPQVAVAQVFHGTERADPPAPAANQGILYFRDNGGGKTQLVAKFPTGVVQVIATEP